MIKKLFAEAFRKIFCDARSQVKLNEAEQGLDQSEHNDDSNREGDHTVREGKNMVEKGQQSLRSRKIGINIVCQLIDNELQRKCVKDIRTNFRERQYDRDND